MTKDFDFSGIWKNTFNYVNKLEPKGGISVYDVKIHKAGDKLVIESVSTAKGDYFVARLTPIANGKILLGTWEEDATPGGIYDKQVYYGAGMLQLDDSGESMLGKIVEYNNDMEIITGDWELTRTDKET